MLCKSVVSNAKKKCLAISGYSESVNTTFVQCDLSFILSQYSKSEILISPIAWYVFPFITISFASLNPFVVIKITFVSSLIEELNNKLFAKKCLNISVIYLKFQDD